MIKAGGDPSNIQLKITGQDSAAVEAISGALKLYFGDKWIELRDAIAYQVDTADTILPLLWDAEYVEDGLDGFVTFTFDTYDPALPLVLEIGYPKIPAWEPTDPRNLDWSTYVGGNDADEFMAVDVDLNGDAYVCGYTYSLNFPVEPGTQYYDAFDDQFMGSEDAIVIKFFAYNKQLAWATYQGGSASGYGAGEPFGQDKAYDIAVYKGDDDALEYAFVTGATYSLDWPLAHASNSPFIAADYTAMTGDDRTGAWICAYTQEQGRLDWSTVLSSPSTNAFSAQGLAIDVDEDGIVFWGGALFETPTDLLDFDFPRVTPTGAFDKGIGGGFFALFDADYQYEWSTPFGGRSYLNGLLDAKLYRANTGVKYAFVTGTTCSCTGAPSWPLDVVDLPGPSDYFQGTPATGPGYGAYIAKINLDTYQVEWSTYWDGDEGDMGLALEVHETVPHGFWDVWVGGTTASTNLSAAQLFDSGTGLHNGTNAGGFDGFLLRFDAASCGMRHGTLYGGASNDAVLDIESAATCENTGCKIFVTGESASPTGLGDLQNSVLYYQPDLGNTAGSDRRDAFILALNAFTHVPIWTTPYGGLLADKGWGVAASPTELFVAGGAISDQAFFPLKEFDTQSLLDYYDDDLLNNVGTANGHYTFNHSNFADPVSGFLFGTSDIWPGHSHDGFIAAFGISDALSVVDLAGNTEEVSAVLDESGHWLLELPGSATDWNVTVYDATGRLVSRSAAKRTTVATVSLTAYAKGVYAVACTNQNGATYSVKLPQW